MDKIEKEAFELFGEMRDATKEELVSIEETIKNISNPTGKDFYSLICYSEKL